jgi:Transposase DDE domain
MDPIKAARTIEQLFGDDLHALRVLSLANGVTGVLHAATLAVTAIGKAYADVIGGDAKHGVKQVDRMLSNDGLDMASLFPPWIRFVVGPRAEIVVAMDWTDFDDDDQSTLAVHLVTNHGRATPLMWKTVTKSTLKGKRNTYEYETVEALHAALPPEVGITVLADRGFGDQKLYMLLETLGWDYVIRFRGVIAVENEDGETRSARDWVPPSGRATMLRNARVTGDRAKVAAVVVVHAKNMREPWCLATTLADQAAGAVVKLYGKRFTIEETFRDEKDPRFGMGLSQARVKSAERRDRLLLLAAVAHALLTLLGAAGESVGLDRTLKVNTVKRRTMSLFNQGAYWYRALPNMRQERLELLMPAYDHALREHEIFRRVFGLI